MRLNGNKEAVLGAIEAGHTTQSDIMDASKVADKTLRKQLDALLSENVIIEETGMRNAKSYRLATADDIPI